MKKTKSQFNLDLVCRKVLMSSYLYYKRNESVISDEMHDSLCNVVVNNWKDVPIRYRRLLAPTKGDIEALRYTSHHCQSTALVRGGAESWLRSKND